MTSIAEIETIASRMAEELQDILDDARDAGSDLPSAQKLLDEWAAVHARLNSSGNDDALDIPIFLRRQAD